MSAFLKPEYRVHIRIHVHSDEYMHKYEVQILEHFQECELQCQSQKDVSTSEYVLRHCHIVTIGTARLPNCSVNTVYWHEESKALCCHIVYKRVPVPARAYVWV